LDHKYLGYNYRMAEMNAALGISQLAILGSLIEKRRKVAKLYEAMNSKDGEKFRGYLVVSQ